jgi:hypothetical protein
MSDRTTDHAAIRDLIDNWILWRDARQWDKFRALWHDDGRMMATWTQGTVDAFIDISKQGFARGLRLLHFQGGTTIELASDRAVAQTKMMILQRAPIHGIVCDVQCTGRFYDLLEKRDGRWGMVLRHPIYERDRVDPVDPAAHLVLDQTLLAQFPEGYRHIAYLQTQIGYTVKRDMPGHEGPELERLYEHGAKWLRGSPAWPIGD